MARNLFITFFLSGLWHGASWNYIIWGSYHGLLVAVWPALSKRLPLLADKGGVLGQIFRTAFTFALMLLGWLLFREHSVAMLASDLLLNPWAAPASEWRMGIALGLEALQYSLPLVLALPWLQKAGCLTIDTARPWRTTLLQVPSRRILHLRHHLPAL